MNFARVCSFRAATAALLCATLSSLSPAAERTPLRAIQTVTPRFPPTLVAQGITAGEAWVMLSIDTEGRVTDALVSRYTHQLIATEVMRLVRAWRFHPVLIDGEPAGVATEIRFRMEATGALITLDAIRTVDQLARRLSGPDFHKNVYSATELDTPPTPIHRVSPQHPGRLSHQPDGDYTAVLEFVIDETGRPRLPALIHAPHPEFGNRAVEALVQWQFTPPTRRGKPVAARVRQEFVFPNS